MASAGFYQDRAVLSWVLLLYLAYPTMVKQAFAAIACERVGDVPRGQVLVEGIGMVKH